MQNVVFHPGAKNISKVIQTFSIPLTPFFAPSQQEVTRMVIVPIPSRIRNDQRTVETETSNQRVNGTNCSQF